MNNTDTKLVEDVRAAVEAAKELHTVASMLLAVQTQTIQATEIDREELKASLWILSDLVGALREFRAGAEMLAEHVEKAA